MPGYQICFLDVRILEQERSPALWEQYLRVSYTGLHATESPSNHKSHQSQKYSLRNCFSIIYSFVVISCYTFWILKCKFQWGLPLQYIKRKLPFEHFFSWSFRLNILEVVWGSKINPKACLEDESWLKHMIKILNKGCFQH